MDKKDIITEIKRLPRDKDGGFARHFKCGDTEYTIRDFKEGVGIDRFTIFEKMAITVGLASSFQGIFNSYRKIKSLCNGVVTKDNTFTDLAYYIQSLEEGILEKTEERFNMSFYLCSLFIVRPGEDLSSWSEAEADEKIKDWQNEGYHEEDFLVLALNGVRGFWTAYKEIVEKTEKLRESTVNT